MTDIRKIRKAAGLCRCGSNLDIDKALCSICWDRWKELASNRLTKKQLGLKCVRCENHRDLSGGVLCSQCKSNKAAELNARKINRSKVVNNRSSSRHFRSLGLCRCGEQLHTKSNCITCAEKHKSSKYALVQRGLCSQGCGRKIDGFSIRNCSECLNRIKDKKLGLPYGTSSKILSVIRHCQACGVPFSHEKNRRACLDHNHTTNKFRGVLCGGCNSALGHAREDASVLNGLILYIELINEIGSAVPKSLIDI